MSKLTRVTAKVFGATADGTLADPEIGQFGSAKAGTYVGTGDIATIQNLPAWSNGWIDAVTPTQQFAPLPERTGVDKVFSYQNAYVLQQGIPEWDSGTDYYTNGFCSKNGKIYFSKTDNNVNNDPESDTVNWKEFVSDTLPDQTGHSGDLLTTDGTDASWVDTDEVYPVVETYRNGASWYRVYSDGFCEQGGTTTGGSSITFLQEFANTSYTLTFGTYYYSDAGGTPITCYSSKATTGFFLQTRWNGSGTNFECSWQASGYIS